MTKPYLIKKVPTFPILTSLQYSFNQEGFETPPSHTLKINQTSVNARARASGTNSKRHTTQTSHTLYSRSKRLRQVSNLMVSLENVHHLDIQLGTRLTCRQAHHSFLMNLLWEGSARVVSDGKIRVMDAGTPTGELRNTRICGYMSRISHDGQGRFQDDIHPPMMTNTACCAVHDWTYLW